MLTILISLLLSFVLYSGCIEETSQIEVPKTVYIDDDYNNKISGWGVDHFNTIQDGIENVSEGGTVYVNNGIYYESIVINKSITLIGEDKVTTVIDSNKKGDVVNIVAENCTIQNINLSNGVQSGVKITSNGATLTNNIFYKNHYGIWISYLSDNIISNNIISNNEYGIKLRSTSNNIISSNQILLNNLEGIILEFPDNETIINNVFQNNGITITGLLSSWNTLVIENNTANDRPIYYYKNENGITITNDASQVILANCSDFEINNINFENITTGIQISYCSNIRMESNYFGSKIQNAIQLYYSDNSTISNNTINSENSIELDESENNIIWQNTLGNTDVAIKMTRSNFNNISENNIFSNREYGLYIQSNSNNNIISRNKIFNNYIGFRLKGSKFNNVYYNEFNNNSYIGLYLCCGAQDNTIYENSFIKNLKHVDYTISNVNYFFKDDLGNYWDDYLERYPNASQLNGVWDTSYLILRSTSQDKYPLVEPVDI